MAMTISTDLQQTAVALEMLKIESRFVWAGHKDTGASSEGPPADGILYGVPCKTGESGFSSRFFKRSGALSIGWNPQEKSHFSAVSRWPACFATRGVLPWCSWRLRFEDCERKGRVAWKFWSGVMWAMTRWLFP